MCVITRRRRVAKGSFGQGLPRMEIFSSHNCLLSKKERVHPRQNPQGVCSDEPAVWNATQKYSDRRLVDARGGALSGVTRGMATAE